MSKRIYLDNQATTKVDPLVVRSMVELYENDYANAGSISHEAGRKVATMIDQALETIASAFHASADEIVITSGATESNNLALMGVCMHPRQKRRKVVSVSTEHRAILDPLERLRDMGFQSVLASVLPDGDSRSGTVDLNHLSDLIDDKTALVTVMLANNEIGVIQPIEQIAQLCHSRGALFHTDATQAVSQIEIDVDRMGIDLMSFSAHKFYGPKGVGGLYVRNRDKHVRLIPQIFGGGQQSNLRSGTLNSPGIVGMAKAIEILSNVRTAEIQRIGSLRDRLWDLIQGTQKLGELIKLNGPSLQTTVRLAGNLNCRWSGVEGQSLMLKCPDICISSGSACTSTEQTPSHVLQGIGLTSDEARCSVRIGLGRFTTEEEIVQAAISLTDAYKSLRKI